MKKHVSKDTALLDEITLFHDLASDLDFLQDGSSLEDERSELLTYRDRAKDLLLREAATKSGEGLLKIAVIGGFSSGKSKFINSLIGKGDVCPVGVGALTCSVTRFSYGDSKKISMAVNDEETFMQIDRDKYVELVSTDSKSGASNKILTFFYKHPSDVLQNIELFDTPGFNNPENTNHEKATLDYASKADMIIFLVDTEKGELHKNDFEIIEKLRKYDKNMKCLLVFSKADVKTSARLKHIINRAREDKRCCGNFTSITAYSANEELKTDWNELEKSINLASMFTRDRVRDRKAFYQEIEGRRSEDGNYQFLVDREVKFSAPVTKATKHSESRLSLLKKLKQLSRKQEKEKLIVAGLNREIAHYQHDRNLYLQKLADRIESQDKPRSNNSNAILKKLNGEINTIMSDFKEHAHEVMFTVKKNTNKEKWYEDKFIVKIGQNLTQKSRVQQVKRGIRDCFTRAVDKLGGREYNRVLEGYESAFNIFVTLVNSDAKIVLPELVGKMGANTREKLELAIRRKLAKYADEDSGYFALSSYENPFIELSNELGTRAAHEQGASQERTNSTLRVQTEMSRKIMEALQKRIVTL